MRVKFTAKYIEHLKCEGLKRLQVWDATLPGFGLRVTSNGRKSWSVMIRRDGKPKRVTLGPYPLLSLQEAASRARKVLLESRSPEIAAAIHVSGSCSTVKEAVDSFIEKYAKGRNKGWKSTQRVLEGELIKPLGGRPLSTVARSDIVTVIDAVVERGATIRANRVLAALRKFFNWTVERGLIPYSPMTGMRAPTKETSRERVLEDDEMKTVWAAANTEKWPFGPIVQLLMLTGQRRGEVTGMAWDELDLEKATWTIPSARTKNARAHVVHLSAFSVEVIESIPRIDEVRWLFSTNGKRPVSGLGKCKYRLESALGKTDWRLHDIRRTVASGMARLGVAPHVIEKVLNHLTGQISGLAAVYNRHAYSKEKVEALDLWSEHVATFLQTYDGTKQTA